MVMEPPFIRQKRNKIRLEIAFLEMKKRLLGSLSDKDEQRLKELYRQLSIRF